MKNQKNPHVVQVETSACETVYEVNGEKLRLWIITGGTTALGFDYTPYEKRYPVVEIWSDKHWHNGNPHGHYDHQVNQNPIQGLTPDILPNGWQDFWDFYNENLPKLQLARKRYNDLPLHHIESKRVRDNEEHTLVKACLGLREYSLAPVTFSSKWYVGRCEEKVALFPAWWTKAQSILNPLFDSNKYLWNEISEEDYQKIVELLKEFNH